MTADIPPDKHIDPASLQAWIDMNTVTGSNPSPGAAFIYVGDLMMGFTGSRLDKERPPIQFDVTPEEAAEVEEVARELGVSVNDIVRGAFEGYMDRVRTARAGDLDGPEV